MHVSEMEDIGEEDKKEKAYIEPSRVVVAGE